MSIKKGFTLAEILIVLILLGVIATLTIPTVLDSFASSKARTTYKKAYSSVTQILSLLKVYGTEPDDAHFADSLFAAIMQKVQVQQLDTEAGDEGNYTYTIKECVKYQNPDSKEIKRYGKKDCEVGRTENDWISAADGTSYNIKTISGSKCETIGEINAKKTVADALNATCAVIEVDTNGLIKGPNTIDTDDLSMEETKKEKLKNDRYYIYIGSDGATPGGRDYLVTGRMVYGEK